MLRHSAFGNIMKTFTSSVQAVVAWKHDPTAHDIPFKAARAKRVPDPAALEQLSIICEEQQGRRSVLCVTCVWAWYTQDTRQHLPRLTTSFCWVEQCKLISVHLFSEPLVVLRQLQTDKLIPTQPCRHLKVSSSSDLLWDETRATRGNQGETRGRTNIQLEQLHSQVHWELFSEIHFFGWWKTAFTYSIMTGMATNT